VCSVDAQQIRSQKRVQSPACFIVISGRDGIEVVPVIVVASPMAGVADDEESAACDCKDGSVTLGSGGCELPAIGFFKGNSLFRFSLAQAFL
jgi:hypothetical protein